MAGHRRLPAHPRGTIAAAMVAVALLAAACGGGDGGSGRASADGTEGATIDTSEGSGVAAVGFTRFDGRQGTFADHPTRRDRSTGYRSG